MFDLMHEFVDLARGVREVSEYTHSGGAGRGACGQLLALGEARVVAEVALVDGVCLLVEIPRVVRARLNAGLAAYALMIMHHDDTGSFILGGRLCRTRTDAWRII